MKKSFYSLFVTAALVLFVSSCASTNYIEKNYTQNIQLLKNSADYKPGSQTIQKQYLVDQERAAQIREYFKQNAGLDLDALAAADKTTWQKATELAVFVAQNIPHNNQKEQIYDRNAITLWEYSRRVPTGFNCRWHATLLSELLLSIGIRNHFVTCLPYDENDNDCHVVNIVWLPELEKWAMIDSDMTEYVTGEDGVPLSLKEMREYIRADKAFTVNVLPGFEDSWVARPSGQDYMQAYWAKNLYWFGLYKVYSFDLEYIQNGERNNRFASEYISLLPGGDDEAFWSY